MNLGINLRVAPTKEEWSSTETQVKALLEHAKQNNYATNVILMLQGVVTKVEQTGKEMMQAIQELQAVKAKNKVLSESSFTAPDIAVKPLKAFLAAKKDVGVPRYTVDQLKEFIAKKKIDFSIPFLVSDGVTDLDTMQSKFTAVNLMKEEYNHINVRYITPAESKKRLSFEQKAAGVGQDEQLQAHMISFEKFFVNCFNYKGKKDFLKSPGANTEFCENAMDAGVLDKDYKFAAFDTMSWMHDLEKAKTEWLQTHSAELSTLLPKDFPPAGIANGEQRLFTFGPSGSGGQLTVENESKIDGLLHGRRRWLFMNQDHFATLREKAGHDMEPASAFVFFENQYAELKEDYGLGSKKLPVLECNQDLGDLLYIPKGMIRVGLNLQDSASFAQKIVTSERELADMVQNEIFNPKSASIPNGFRAFACFGYDTLKMNKVGIPTHMGMLENPQQASLIRQIMHQNFGATPVTTNLLALSIVANCKALSSTKKDQLKNTQCPMIYDACRKTLEENAKQMELAVPAFLRKGKGEL